MRIITPAQLLSRIRPGREACPPDVADAPTIDELHNGRLLRFDAPFTSLAFGVANFYALFAIQLGASNAVIGWLSSGPALVNLFGVIPNMAIIQRSKSYAYTMVAGGLGHRLLVAAIAIVPLLPTAWRAAALVVLVTLGSLPATLWGLSFHTSSGEMFAPRHRARYIGQRWAIANITGTVGLYALGLFVDAIHFPSNFQFLFLGVGVVTMSSMALIARMRMPPRPPLDRTPASERVSLASLRRLASQHRSFVLFEIAVLFAYTAVFFSNPVFRIFWVRDLGASGAWIGALTAAFAIGATAGNLVWGRVSRTDRDRLITTACAAGVMALYPVLTAVSRSLWPVAGVMALSGFFSAGNDLMIFNRVVSISPRQGRPAFISAHNVTSNIAGFIAPLISTALSDAWGARFTLLAGAALGVLGTALLYLLGWGRPAIPQDADYGSS